MTGRFRTKTKPLKKRHVFLIVLILSTILSIQGFIFVERNLEPALKGIAAAHIKQRATLAITQAISEKTSNESPEQNHLAIIEKDNNQRIQLISFDKTRQAKVLTEVTQHANETLIQMSKEAIEIPLGQALNSNILAQFGPKVPIALFPIGSAKADIELRMEEAGINVVAIEVYLRVEANVRIVIPFTSEEAVVTTEFPIEVHILPGEVPNYYFKSEDGTISPIPNIALPEQTTGP